MKLENSKFVRNLIRQILRIRQFQTKRLRVFANTVRNKKILEIGSGKKEGGFYPYSFYRLFDKSNNFLMTDINPKFGHQILDITQMQLSNKFDIILCLNVLEHVYDYEAAISNLHKALKKNGFLIVSVPYGYPLHDEPGDFWRFTEHSLRKMFSSFSIINFKHQGIRKFPITYYLELKK